MILWRMKTLMNILCLFVVFSVVSLKSDNVYEGTVGEKVEIRCPYSNDYKYMPKFLCRDPCGSSGHVLIKSEKTDQVVSDGRYSLIDTVSSRSFTVTISDLRLKDSGVYYCGVDKWFRDKLNKVNLSVRQAAPVNRPSHTSEKTITTSTWTTTTLTSTDKGSSSQQKKDFFCTI
ncbi:CMRF35-like molecule 5 [Pimephales promelas]|uniref:CMRF35-like molecule 5 n=1 Tax=Pimephales promelas TaxID=90988 RepID=UPI0019559E88|nr:CMRF35-like molecule 5 [Pimephales promelas]